MTDRSWLTAFLILSVAATACSDDGLNALPPAPADIQVDPESLTFDTARLDQVSTRVVTIRNVGEMPLTLTSIALSAGTSSELSWQPTDPEVNTDALPVLGANDTLELQVLFAPTDRSRELGALLIDSSDEDEPQVEIPIASFPIGAPSIICNPNPAVLVAIPPATAQQTVTCVNDGTETLTVSALEIDPSMSSELSLQLPATPFEVPAGAPFDILVGYAPTGIGLDTGRLTVISNAVVGDYIIDLTGEGVEQQVCRLSMFPFALSFSGTYVGQANDKTAALTNTGNGPCSITSVAMSGFLGGEFAYVGQQTFTMQPGANRNLTVRYLPTDEASDTEILSVNTADPNAGASVFLNGSGVAARISVYPCPADFATLPLGCAAEKNLTVEASGSASLSISSATLTGGAGQFTLIGSPASSLSPGATSTFAVGFNPSVGGPQSATLTIVSNDPFNPTFVCDLKGTGSADGRVIEEFDTATPMVDMLLIVDDSGSMDDQAQTLADSMQGLFDFLDGLSVSFHLGMTTTDVSNDNPIMPGKQGRLVGNTKIITNTTPNPVQVLRDNINSTVFGGDATERGLEAAKLALTEPLLSTDNAGFLRAGAKLFVIYLSDEDDQSPEPSALHPVDYYVQILLAAKQNDPNMLGAGAFVGMPGDTCGPQVGQRYLDFVDDVGGVKSTICTADFSPGLTQLGTAITDPPDSFYLGSPVVPGTLEVYIDGVLQPAAAWVHDTATNSITFNTGYDPPADVLVRIEYDTLCSS